MERMNVMYITEEEKLMVLRNRMEQERKANRRRMTEHERTHRIMGAIMLVLALVCLYIGGEMIIGAIMCGLFSAIGFCAREEDREEWVEQ